MEFLAHGCGPNILEEGTFDQLSVVCNGFLGDGVDYTIAVVFVFDGGVGELTVVLLKGLGNCVHGCLVQSDVNEVK
jgi:hypothetical protein